MPNDTTQMLGQVIDTAKRVIGGVRSDQLGLPTPCSDWTVRDVLDHLYSGAAMFAEAGESGSCPPERIAELAQEKRVTDDGYADEVCAEADRSVRAWREHPEMLEKIVTLPFGQMPGDIAVKIGICDVLTHAWDLATATGQSREFDRPLCEETLVLQSMLLVPELRDGQLFREEQPVSADAHPADRLAAFAGRVVE